MKLSAKALTIVTFQVAGVVGLCTLAGLVVGLVVALNASNRKMDRYAKRVLRYTDSYTDEIVSTLDKVNGSPYKFCSSEDVALLRTLVFNGHLVKEIARVRNGEIYCTSINGRLADPIPQPPPTLVVHSGRKIWLNITLASIPGVHMDITGTENADFMASPGAFSSLGELPMTYTTTITNRPENQVVTTAGDPLKLTNDEVFAQKEVLKGGTLYRSICSARYSPCIVVGLSLRDAVRINDPLIGGFVTIGVLAGSMLGLTILLQPRTRSLANQLRRALRRNSLTVVYQPIVDVRTGRILGAEALARWTNEEGQVVSPDLFVTTAERLGFVCQLTRVVLRKVISEMGDFLRANSDFRVNVNIAAADLADPQFLPMLEKLLQRNKVASSSINLELTERSTADHHLAISAVGKLRERGHAFYIDDFGTGYSSLSYLHQLAVDAIKIDRAFTQAIGTGSLTAAIVPQILAMAKTLNIKVVIEGIEKAEQVAHFAMLEQPVMAQGWYFGKPVAAAKFMEQFQSNARAEIPA